MNALKRALLNWLLKGCWGVCYEDHADREFYIYASAEEAQEASDRYWKKGGMSDEPDYWIGKEVYKPAAFALPGFRPRARRSL